MKSKIKQAFSMAADSYDSVAYLQNTVADELLMNMSPLSPHGTLLDLGCGTGYLSNALLNSTQLQHIIAVDIAHSMLQKSRLKLQANNHLINNISYLCSDAEALALNNQSIDCIVSNLALQWCMPINTALNECKRVLKPNSLFIFSTFGVNTLHELKSAWASVDNYKHVNDFYSAQVLEQLLIQAGFNQLQITSQYYRSYYDSVLNLMRELKQLGANSVLNSQSQPSITRTALNQMIKAYCCESEKTQISATFEIIHIIARS